jgi:hypothetical protein
LPLSRIDAVPVLESGTLFERSRQFSLGYTFNSAFTDLSSIAVSRVLGREEAGWWECELPANTLSWTTGVYDIFGLPRGARVTRDEAVGFYFEESRAAMERLRSHAIEHQCGFILDAQVRPASGDSPRWMRLIATPLIENGLTVGLSGLKLRI